MFVTRNNINSGLLSVIKHTSATFVTCRIKFSSPNMYVRIGDHLPGSIYLRVSRSQLLFTSIVKEDTQSPFHAAYRGV